MRTAKVYDPHGRELDVESMHARPLAPDDDVRELLGGEVIGCITVRVCGGGVLNALAVLDRDGNAFALYWCRYLHAMRALPVERTVLLDVERATDGRMVQ